MLEADSRGNFHGPRRYTAFPFGTSSAITQTKLDKSRLGVRAAFAAPDRLVTGSVMAELTKRDILTAPLLAAFAAPLIGEPARANPKSAKGPAIARGRFAPTPASLKTYQTPEWFRDAKFGIWAHWGPQAVPRAGDWYARNMYIWGHPQYEHQ